MDLGDCEVAGAGERLDVKGGLVECRPLAATAGAHADQAAGRECDSRAGGDGDGRWVDRSALEPRVVAVEGVVDRAGGGSDGQGAAARDLAAMLRGGVDPEHRCVGVGEQAVVVVEDIAAAHWEVGIVEAVLLGQPLVVASVERAAVVAPAG